MWKLQRILAMPALYRLFGRVAAGNAYDAYVRDFVRPVAGQRVLDIGCGPGDILARLPDVDYLGIDHHAPYIAAARKRYGNRGTFRCEDVAASVIRDAGAFDLVMANGLLHHLNDDEVRNLLRLAARALKPSGRLVTLDGCFVPEQSRMARFLLRMDRGNHVRPPDAYASLAAEVFGTVQPVVRHDLMRIPYTHIILTCSDAVAARQAA